MKRSSSFLLPILAAVPAPHLAAEVIDVRGPSPDYTEIAGAVIAATDGDVIRVWPGKYQPFWIDDKSLTLVAATSSSAVEINGTYRVKNLAPHRSVELSGISATGVDGYALVVSDCQGSVRIREGVFHGASASGGFPWEWDGFTGVLVTHCDDVEMTYCTIRGGYPGWGEVAGSGGQGMLVEASNTSLFASTIEGIGGSTIDDPGESGFDGGDGLGAWGGGRIYISGCTLIGGPGAAADFDMDLWTGEYGWGGDGGWAFRGVGVEVWFLDNTFQPGSGGWSPDSGRYGTDGQDATPGTHLPGACRLLRASRLTDDASTIGLIFTGSPGDLAYLQISLGPGYTFDPHRGPFLLSQPTPPAIGAWKILGPIGPSGVLQTSISVRDLPSLGHATPHFQGHLVGGESYYTASSWTVVLDSGW
jgi:hypothetical protein